MNKVHFQWRTFTVNPMFRPSVIVISPMEVYLRQGEVAIHIHSPSGQRDVARRELEFRRLAVIFQFDVLNRRVVIVKMKLRGKDNRHGFVVDDVDGTLAVPLTVGENIAPSRHVRIRPLRIGVCATKHAGEAVRDTYEAQQKAPIAHILIANVDTTVYSYSLVLCFLFSRMCAQQCRTRSCHLVATRHSHSYNPVS